jgi:hypothetical protein
MIKRRHTVGSHADYPPIPEWLRQGSPGRQSKTPLGPAIDRKPLVRQVLTEKDIDYFWHNLAGALVELLLGEIGNRVRHR